MYNKFENVYENGSYIDKEKPEGGRDYLCNAERARTELLGEAASLLAQLNQEQLKTIMRWLT